MKVTVVIIDPRSLQKRELDTLDTEDPKKLLEELPDDLKQHILLIVDITKTGQVNLMSRVAASNVDYLANNVMGYVSDLVQQNQKELTEQFKPKNEPITEQEQDIFKMLKENYDSLLMVKTEFNGVPTMAICDTTKKDSQGNVIISPLVICINPELFKFLKPPEVINVKPEE